MKKNLISLMLFALDGRVFAGPTPAPRQQKDAPPPAHAQDSLEELRAKMVQLHEESDAIRARVDAEHRSITDDEATELEAIADQFDAIDDEVKMRERIAAQGARLKEPGQRRAQPEDPAEPTAAADAPRRQRITGGDAPGVTKGAWGYRSMGEFAKVVHAAARGVIDPRLTAAATTYGNEATQADGGYAVPPDFRETIVQKVQSEESLLSRTDQQYTSSNKLTVPLDNTTPWSTTGGIQVYWEGEAQTMPQSKPALGQLECKANKMTALVPMTDELLEDAPSLSRYLPGKVAAKFVSKINNGIVNGDGTGKPQGVLQSPSKLQVAKEGGQAAATLNFTNIIKMWSRMYAPLRAGAIWLINQDIEPQLLSLVVPGTQPSYPAYMPPGGLSGSPYGTLLGRPLIPVEACQTLGTEGDIILTNLSSYLTVQKVGGVRQDVSMHLYFDQGLTAFRFVMRLGGQSWWDAVAARQNGANTLSNIVTLQTR